MRFAGGTAPPKQKPRRSVVRMEAANIPAFQIEDYMPPRERIEVSRRFRIQRSMSETEPDEVLEAAREEVEWAGRELPRQAEGYGASSGADGVAERFARSEGTEDLRARAAIEEYFVRGGKNRSGTETRAGQERSKRATDLLKAGIRRRPRHYVGVSRLGARGRDRGVPDLGVEPE